MSKFSKETKKNRYYKFYFQYGCSHDCKYCSAKARASRYGRNLPSDWHNERMRRIHLAAIIDKCDCDIIFPTRHDITPKNLDESIFYIRWFLSVSHTVFVDTKPHFECIKRICEQFDGEQEQIFLRFTIGSTDSETLKFWEPNAPDFEERFKCLEYAHKAGYVTGVRVEPMLDNKVENLIRMALPYVTDGIYVGIPKRLTSCLCLNGFNDEETWSRARELMLSLSDDYIMRLYDSFAEHELVKFEKSIRKIVLKHKPSEKFMNLGANEYWKDI